MLRKQCIVLLIILLSASRCQRAFGLVSIPDMSFLCTAGVHQPKRNTHRPLISAQMTDDSKFSFLTVLSLTAFKITICSCTLSTLFCALITVIPSRFIAGDLSPLKTYELEDAILYLHGQKIYNLGELRFLTETDVELMVQHGATAQIGKRLLSKRDEIVESFERQVNQELYMTVEFFSQVRPWFRDGRNLLGIFTWGYLLVNGLAIYGGLAITWTLNAEMAAWIKRFLETCGAHPDGFIGNDGSSALIRASMGGHARIVRVLLRANAYADHRNNQGVSALMSASAKGHNKVTLILVKSGASLDLLSIASRTALMAASSGGHEDVTRTLLRCGASVNLKDKDGMTALMLASEKGHAKVVHTLLRSGANPDVTREDGMSALMLATRFGRIRVVYMLLDHGADVNLSSEDGWSALMCASAAGRTDVARILLMKGASVDPRERVISLLHVGAMCASAAGCANVARILRRKDTNIDTRGWLHNNCLVTSLMLAMYWCPLKFESALLVAERAPVLAWERRVREKQSVAKLLREHSRCKRSE